MKNSENNEWSIHRMILLLSTICSIAQVSAKEHSWVTPLGCTPAELLHMMGGRQMLRNDQPVLLPQERLVIKLDQAQLVLEVVAIEAKATKVNWLLIESKKVLSGSALIENSEINAPQTKDNYKPFDFERVGGAEFKGFLVTCSSDVQLQRVTFTIGGRPYALITKESQGEQATASDGTKPPN